MIAVISARDRIDIREGRAVERAAVGAGDVPVAEDIGTGHLNLPEIGIHVDFDVIWKSAQINRIEPRLEVEIDAGYIARVEADGLVVERNLETAADGRFHNHSIVDVEPLISIDGKVELARKEGMHRIGHIPDGMEPEPLGRAVIHKPISIHVVIARPEWLDTHRREPAG